MNIATNKDDTISLYEGLVREDLDDEQIFNMVHNKRQRWLQYHCSYFFFLLFHIITEKLYTKRSIKYQNNIPSQALQVNRQVHELSRSLITLQQTN